MERGKYIDSPVYEEGVRNSAYSYFRLSERNVHATIPKGIMGYDQCTVLALYLSNLLLLLSSGTRKHTSMASRAILSNFFEEQ